ncbi:MAG: hypothetical protein ACE1ZE_05825 [Candidatus Binatia bacterium]
MPAEGLLSNPADFLLIMGGPMSVNDSEPWIIKEIEFITHTVKRGAPVLGVCLGCPTIGQGTRSTSETGAKDGTLAHADYRYPGRAGGSGI